MWRTNGDLMLAWSPSIMRLVMHYVPLAAVLAHNNASGGLWGELSEGWWRHRNSHDHALKGMFLPMTPAYVAELAASVAVCDRIWADEGRDAAPGVVRFLPIQATRPRTRRNGEMIPIKPAEAFETVNASGVYALTRLDVALVNPLPPGVPRGKSSGVTDQAPSGASVHS